MSPVVNLQVLDLIFALVWQIDKMNVQLWYWLIMNCIQVSSTQLQWDSCMLNMCHWPQRYNSVI
ncbi:Uncharacterised protein [Mycobacteroides abscessus subsp. abscessus]|nr:Uncharacterised protein [Mycobacteroides abscessus subsp. abscessus]